MTMAYWNGMTWGVSTKEIAFLESLTTSFGIETSTNADKEGNSPTEQVAKSLVEFSLSTTYRVETGTSDIRGMINAWNNKIGKTGPLIIGSSVFGPDNMQLQSVGVSNLQISASGIMRAVTLSFKFKEIEETESGVTTVAATATTIATSQSPATVSDNKAIRQETAVGVTASEADKASKKTVTFNSVNSRKRLVVNEDTGTSVIE